MLAFKLDDHSIGVSRVGPDDSASRWVKQLLGRPVDDPVTALASGLDCSPREVVEVLRARGDQELADTLDSI